MNVDMKGRNNEIDEMINTINSQQKELKELREEKEYQDKHIDDLNQLSTDRGNEIIKLRERVKMVLDACDKNESLSDFAIATDSVRAMLTDYPLNK